MRTTRQRRGDRGEQQAEATVIRWGWDVIDRNWRGDSGEVDLIAFDDDCLVFIEVKLRTGNLYGTAEESLSWAKQQRLLTLGAEYLEQHPEFEDNYWRVDLIALTIDRDYRVSRVTHLSNACSVDG